jgi:transposase InsO family protein
VELSDKARLLRAIERSRGIVRLRRVLRIAGLSPARLHAWRRAAQACELQDQPSCPGSAPHRLTAEEISGIHEMVTAPAYRHVPTSRLAMLAQRLSRVFACAASWHRLVRDRGWRRPRLRVHPDMPKVGIRATKPNAFWHCDTTVIRLLDGTRAYLHAVIDNFSRRILAWRLADRFEVGNSVAVLVEAGRAVKGSATPTLIADSGVENRNHAVDELIESGLLRRLLAMTEINFSNSLIEAWWRCLKHQWLFLNTLDSVARVRKLVEFYVTEHNSRLPHSAFRGQTPDEMYFGTGVAIPEKLAQDRTAARERRLQTNRALQCGVCS